MEQKTCRFVADLIAGRARPRADLNWPEVERVVSTYRLGGLAHRACGADDGVPDGVRRSWEGAFRAQAVRASLLAEEWTALEAALAAAGVRPWLLKGGWMNARGYYELGERALDDIDVVVPKPAAALAIHVLQRAGWRPWAVDPEGTVQWSGAAAFEARGAARAAGLTIDLHWNVEYGSLRGGDGSPSPAPWGACTDRPEFQLVTAVEHFLNHWRCRAHLLGLADVARLLSGPIDLPEVVAQLRSGPWRHVSAGVLQGVADRMGDEVSDRVRAAAERGTAFRFALPEVVAGAGSRPGRLAGIWSRCRLRGVRASVREALDALFPPGHWLQSRYGNDRPVRRARMDHLIRVLGWSAGATPSPLAPNQE